VDIKADCEVANLGSNPSTLATQKGDKMYMKNRIKIEKEATEYRQRIVSINGISDFWEHPRYENCWIYNGRNPTVNCCVTVVDDYVEISNVMVHNPTERKSGHGSAMVADIRRAFPNHWIWVDTWNCSRGFWEIMKARGKIDIIANDYPWPCINTTCKVCHSHRIVPTRRYFQ
tara:strand:+ start:283 stop:801 length:519 start_codon:yes stop_codon:yes gene_type:complete